MHVFSLSSAAWRFRNTKEKKWRPAQIPGCVHTDLIRAKQIPDPFWGTNEAGLQWIEERDWEYRATFSVAADLLAAENLELVADGLDTVATVRLNGHEVGRSENMFLGQRWAVKPLLRRGANELAIRFTSAMDYIRANRTSHTPREINDPVGRCTVIRKQQCQFGWDWGPRFVTAGIWRDLRIEAWSGNRLDTIRVTQTHAAAGPVALTLAPELARPEPAATCRWRLTLDRALVGEGTGTEIAIQQPQLW